MTQADILIKNGIILAMDESMTIIPCGYVAVSGDRIVAMGEGEPDVGARRVIDAGAVWSCLAWLIRIRI